MAELKGPLKLQEVLKEPDLFKLAILGHALVEEAIDAAIAEAFGGSTPGELKALPFRTRLALFGALTQMPKKYLNAVPPLTKLRNEFAHGRITELTPERAEVLASALRPLLKESVNPMVASALDAPQEPRSVLMRAISTAYHLVGVARDLARTRREEQRKAVSFQQDLQKLLTDHELA